MDRLQNHHHLNGRTIRIGNNILFGILADGMGIHLRNHQGNLGIHAEGTCVVNDDTPLPCGNGSELFANGSTSGKKPDLNTFERVLVQNLDTHILSIKLEALTRASFGCQQLDLLDRKFSLLQNANHLISYGAGSSDHSDVKRPFCHENPPDVPRLFASISRAN